jgi:glycerate kinase
MERFILIPDSFKGTMSSAEICSVMAERISFYYPGAEVIPIPVADGGEGSVDCFLEALGGERIRCMSENPFREPMESFYGLTDNGRTAVIEMAASAGLPLAEGRADPTVTSTYGVGLLIRDALDKSVEKLIIGLGGSATNDGGCGCACALGAVFTDDKGEAFVPTGGTLARIRGVDLSGLDKRIAGVSIAVMCDIDNPMYGPNGAAYIFGPQKGATPEAVELLDAGLRSLSDAMIRELGIDCSALPGGGAAGAMGAGLVAFLSGKLQMGIEAVLDAVNFDGLLPGTGMVFTGEGKIDGQSLRGKVVIGVARRAKKAGIPVTAIVGDIGDDVTGAYGEGVTAIFSINLVAVDFAKAKPRAKNDLSLTMDNLMRFYKGMGMFHLG